MKTEGTFLGIDRATWAGWLAAILLAATAGAGAWASTRSDVVNNQRRIERLEADFQKLDDVARRLEVAAGVIDARLGLIGKEK